MTRNTPLLPLFLVLLCLPFTAAKGADEAPTAAPAAAPAPLQAPARPEWRFAAGGEFNADSHGILDLGFRKGAFSIELLTDTLEVRYAPEQARGRWWVAARGEGGAAGLMISPWAQGAPDPSSALLASYAGVEGGWLRYLPRGLYAGGQAVARLYTFAPFSDATTVAIPGTTPFATLDLLAGYYSPRLSGWTRVGADLEGQTLAPHAHGSLGWRQPLLGSNLQTRVHLNAGIADGQGLISRTRLGGLNPYVVPLAGAAWAEWWVEDYVAARIGLGHQTEFLDLEVFADGAWFDGAEAVGAGARLRLTVKHWFVDGAFGYAPAIPRQEGVGRSSVFLLLGRTWSRLGRG